jgi:hypothetical protein
MSVWAVLFVVLLIAWLGGFTVFHVAGGLIHLLLVFAFISLILHFVLGARPLLNLGTGPRMSCGYMPCAASQCGERVRALGRKPQGRDRSVRVRQSMGSRSMIKAETGKYKTKHCPAAAAPGEVFGCLGESPNGKKCKGMVGLVEDGSGVMDEDFDGAVMNAALISAAQRVEHEIAA